MADNWLPQRQGPRVAEQALSAEEIAFLDAFLSAAVTVQRNLDSDLKCEQNRTLSEYITLRRLGDAPDRRMRINELAATAFLSLSRMSRIVEKLEQQGLVTREQVPDDRRGWNAVLTEAGLEWLRRGDRAYAASVHRHVLDQLDQRDLPALTSVARVLANLPDRKPAFMRAA
ncbi:MarR family transcriptional regulator [Actinoplanes sp. NPDC048796]|uniref:MarR family winged helix-turn-helix transcriptional regulator n=1 Tax=unclassified Actinoplanes TaxID=2626549 RepID=UPI0033E6E97E